MYFFAKEHASLVVRFCSKKFLIRLYRHIHFNHSCIFIERWLGVYRNCNMRYRIVSCDALPWRGASVEPTFLPSHRRSFNAANHRDLPSPRRWSLLPARLEGLSFFSFPVASIPRTCMLANGCGQITALPAFETLLTLRILARRARLTSLCPVENDDITIKLPSAYGN